MIEARELLDALEYLPDFVLSEPAQVARKRLRVALTQLNPQPKEAKESLSH